MIVCNPGVRGPHVLQSPIPVFSLDEILPEIDTEGIPSLEAVLTGYIVESDCGTSLYRNFIFRAYCLLCSQKNRDDDQLKRGRERLKNQIIVDLGSGTGLDAYSLACGVDAAAYIAVEPFHATELLSNLARGQQPHRMFNQIPLCGDMIPTSIVCDHALAFLRRLPDGSVSIIASGLDFQVLTKTYNAELAQEIVRTLHPQGLFLRCKSWLEPQGLVHEVVSPGDNLDYFYHD